MNNFVYNVSRNEYYIFYWSYESSIKNQFEGLACFDFSLESYDTNKADSSCPLGVDTCSYDLEELSCVVVDMYNISSDEGVYTNIETEGRGVKYFGIVMAPFLVMAFLMLGIWKIIK